uniref:Uncharacterized protein n=1 Tax=Clytia hemisphaerica TaxID=252671 RepID=A0A7M5V215_9CNID
FVSLLYPDASYGLFTNFVCTFMFLFSEVKLFYYYSSNIKCIQENSIAFIFNQEQKKDFKEIIQVNIRENEFDEWKEIEKENFKMMNYSEVNIGGLKEETKHEIQFVVKAPDDSKLILTKAGLYTRITPHRQLSRWLPNITLISHPFGTDSDVSRFLKKSPSGDKLIRFQTGDNEECRLTEINCRDYVKKNFSESCVVVPQLYQLEENSPNHHIAKTLVEIGKGKESYILSKVDFHRQISCIIGFNPNQIQTDFEHLLQGGNAMIFYPAEIPAIFLITLPENMEEKIQHVMVRANENAKAFLSINDDLLKDGEVVLINVVAALYHKREDINCKDCKELMMFKDDLETGCSEWWEDFKIQWKEGNRNSNVNKTTVLKTAFRSVVMSASVDVRFPRLFAGGSEIIVKRVLTEDQRNALEDASKRKIIAGPYGSGKSVIVNQAIQKFSKKEDFTVFYINFEEYSLLNVLMKKMCQTDGAEFNCVVDLSPQSGSGEMLSLNDCLNYISTKYNSGNDKIYAVIDEYDSEDMSTEDAEALNTLFNSTVSDQLHVLLAIQSCQKHRVFEEIQPTKEYSSSSLDELNFTKFELQRTMRFSSKIGDAIKESLIMTEKKQAVYTLPSNEEKIAISSENQAVASSKVQPTVTFDPQVIQSVESPNHPHQEAIKAPTLKLDALCKLSNGPSDSKSKIISTFHYPTDFLDGSGVEGDIPYLLRLDAVNDVEKFAYFLTSFVKKKRKPNKWMFICNSIELLPLARCALGNSDVRFVEYTDNIKGKHAPSTETKETIIGKWQNDVEALLVDCRGCRGMDCDEVLVLWNEEDIHSRHMFGEALSRARTKLSIVTVKGGKSESNLDEVIETLQKKNMVNDKTALCTKKATEILFDIAKYENSDDANFYSTRQIAMGLLEKKFKRSASESNLTR